MAGTLPPGRKASYWRYWREVEGDPSKVVCQVENCGATISRGKPNGPSKNLSPAGMKTHLSKVHTVIYESMMAEKEATVKKKKEEEDKKRKRDETVKGKHKMFNLKTHRDRQAFLDMV